jgi:prepilin-type N-terminal cleavage/methylation domain-containing protein
MVKLHRQQGFTLLETLIGMLILSIVALALGGTFFVGYQALTAEANQLSADKALSGAAMELVPDLSTSTVTASSLPLTPGTATFLTLTYGGPPVTVTYTIDASGNLLRSVAAGRTTVVARGMKSLDLASAGCVFTVTLVPSAVQTPQTLTVAERVGVNGCD